MPVDKIELTERQQEAIGQVVVDQFGANFQTGKSICPPGLAYVAWENHPGDLPRFAYIDPEGTVTYV